MPNRNEIYEEIGKARAAAQDDVRRRYLKELNELTKRDTIIYATAFSSKRLPQLPSFLISLTSDDIQGFISALHGLNGKKLDLILHSPGGSLEAAEQIVSYLRSKYGHIRAIVPQNAMSAATMLACACDEIVMGKHSAIGPKFVKARILDELIADFLQTPTKETVTKTVEEASDLMDFFLGAKYDSISFLQQFVDHLSRNVD